MEHAFWHERWEKRETAFHEGRPNALLVKHLPVLDLQPGSRIFLPLCGKTIDIHYLLAQGMRIVGIDLSPIAVSDLFEDLGLTPRISEAGRLTHYGAPGIDIFLGDLFALDRETLGEIDAVYDRAAIVALPREMRAYYARHLVDICVAAPQLCLTFEYDQALFDGPPFSVEAAEIDHLYAATHKIALLERGRVPGGLKRREAVDQAAWLLTRR
ncbi:thiopurine S-methyltransferase [Fulvimarina endophytica]|uniref:Thiopurine S-methyltransferase n=1 Tax=Fulvimarina endophytica TaxID=2293836 RepID=A0A371X772_9HYPH|nr:thiopurine S-methyltransferase [Fulvimarina endophytica]RFC65075.1 thiopurine S-methyltransferase [Fulvimarina endophytica]